MNAKREKEIRAMGAIPTSVVGELLAEIDRLRDEQRAGFAREDGFRRELIRLRVALRSVKHMLIIPAAEYVPAIPDCWEVIDRALGDPDTSVDTH
jgi:hypothetical protein